MKWDDLADSELRARLEQHGLDPVSATALVVGREDPEFGRIIDETLDG